MNSDNDGPNPGEDPDSHLDAKIYRSILFIKELFGFLRLLVICGTGLIGLGIIAWMIVSVTTVPPWVQALAILLGTSPGAIRLAIEIRSFRRQIKDIGRSQRETEQLVDPSRSSSGLNPDGTEPHDE